MRKLLCILALVLISFVSVAQKPSRDIYTQVIVTEGEGKPIYKDVENVFYFNYGGESRLKVYYANGSVELYDQISERRDGSTVNGSKYVAADFKKPGTNFKFTLQVFLNPEYGVRMVFENGNLLQFVKN
jgi:hypothetical protein